VSNGLCNVNVVAHRFAVFAFANALGGEEKPPANFAVSIFVFDSDGVGQMDADAVRDVRLMKQRDARAVLPQRRDQFAGQDGVPIAIRFGVAHGDALTGQVNVFDTKTHTLEQAQAATIAQLRHQTQFVIGHCCEDTLHFLAG